MRVIIIISLSNGVLMLRATSKTLLFLGASALSAIASAHAQDGAESENAEFLGTITLGESKRAVQTDTATPITVINQGEIDDRQASTIAELIDSVPGVALVNGGTPVGSGINIRGFGANGTYGTDHKVAIIVDGATTGSEEIYRMGNQLFTDPYLYKSVSVTRGPVGGFEFGSGLIGGLVQLETKDASDFTNGEVGFKVAATVGLATNQDAYNGSFIGAFQPTENIELLANVAYRESDDYEDGDDNVIPNTAYDLPSYLLKGRFSFGDAHTVTASYTQTTIAERDVDYNTFGDFPFGNVDRDIDSQTASLLYNFAPTNSDLINTDVSVTYANQEIESRSVDPDDDGLPSLSNADHQYETLRFKIANSTFFETGVLEHDLRAGVEFIAKERATATSAPGGEDDRIAVFLIDNINFGNGFTFSPALRYETQSIEGQTLAGFSRGRPVESISDENDNSALMGGASLRYEFDNGLAFFGSYAETESFPILDDIGNSAGKFDIAEKGKTYEVGGSYYKNGLFNDGDTLAVKINYFDSEITDVTSVDFLGADEIEISGVEVETSLALESGFYVDFNGSFTDTTAFDIDPTPDDFTPLVVEHDYENAAPDGFRLTVGQKFGETLDLSFEAVRDQDNDLLLYSRRADDRSETVFGDGFSDAEREGFTIYNLRVTYTPDVGFLEALQVRLGVENISDELYTPAQATRTAPGRNVKVTISSLF